MTRFHFQRPDGQPNIEVQNISRHLNPFIPPQGFTQGGPTGEGDAIVQTNTLTAIVCGDKCSVIVLATR